MHNNNSVYVLSGGSLGSTRSEAKLDFDGKSEKFEFS